MDFVRCQTFQTGASQAVLKSEIGQDRLDIASSRDVMAVICAS